MPAAMLGGAFLGSRAAVGPARAAPAAAAARPAARIVVRAERTLWLPGTEPPAHLNGELPGDFGFDPLGLGTDPDRLKWYQEAEKTNARWAMAGVAGILGQEVLGVTPRWFDAGAKDYGWNDNALLAIEFLILGFFELKRYEGFKKTGQSGVLDSYPFDPAGLNSEVNQVKEIKNGRLAMIAFVGFSVAALLTRQGPIEALKSHISDPLGSNIIANINKIPQVIGGLK